MCQDTLAEWLRRRPAKPLGSARAGSNPAGVVFVQDVPVSLAGQDTWLSPKRPGFKSRTGNFLPFKSLKRQKVVVASP